VLIGLGTAVGGYRRWRANEDAMRADRPLPRNSALAVLAGAVAVVVVVVGVLVVIEVVTR
jgi:putative membrane protein